MIKRNYQDCIATTIAIATLLATIIGILLQNKHTNLSATVINLRAQPFIVYLYNDSKEITALKGSYHLEIGLLNTGNIAITPEDYISSLRIRAKNGFIITSAAIYSPNLTDLIQAKTTKIEADFGKPLLNPDQLTILNINLGIGKDSALDLDQTLDPETTIAQHIELFGEIKNSPIPVLAPRATTKSSTARLNWGIGNTESIYTNSQIFTLAVLSTTLIALLTIAFKNHLARSDTKGKIFLMTIIPLLGIASADSIHHLVQQRPLLSPYIIENFTPLALFIALIIYAAKTRKAPVLNKE